MNIKKWREDFHYDVGHSGYMVWREQYIPVTVIGKTHYENGARKGSVVVTKWNQKKKVIKLFTKKEVKEFSI